VKLRWNFMLNFLITIAVLLALVGFQTTFWYQVLGTIPAPMLWLNLVVYIILYRKPAPAIMTIYAMGFILMSFTSMPLRMMWINLLILFIIVYGIKSRVFWSGSRYYAIMSAFSCFMFQVIYLSTSMAIERSPASFEIADRLIQIIITPLFALPMYGFLWKLDTLTQSELHESGGLNI